MAIEIGPGIELGLGVVVGGTAFANASGGTITTYTSGNITYRVHTFTSSGDFVTSTTPLPVELLVIGGGGGGGGAFLIGSEYVPGGGGGAGGYVNIDEITANASTTYSVVVGSGGSAGNVGTTPNNGGNSSAFSYTAIGGGSGGHVNALGYINAEPGGSGGGTPGNKISPIAQSIQFSTLGYGNGTQGGTDQTTLSSINGGTGGGSLKNGDDLSGPGQGRTNNITGTNVVYAAGGEPGTWQPSPSFASAGNTSSGYGSGGGGGAYGGGTGYNRQSGTDGAGGVVIIAYRITSTN